MDRVITPERPTGSVRRLALAVAAGSTLALAVAAPAGATAPSVTPLAAPSATPPAAGAPTDRQATDRQAEAPPAAQTGKFVPVDPHRILDTRSGVGVPAAGRVPGGSHIRVPVGLPAGDVKAVVMNVTVTGPSEESHLTVFPDGTPLPTASNLNFTPGQTVPNAVTVPVSNGFVDFFNNSGSTDVIADLAGYYTDSTAVPGSSYVPVSPARLLDTRAGAGRPVGADGTVNLRVAGTGGVPAAGVTAVVLNVTATETTAESFLTVHPHGGARPDTSNLNWRPGETTPNLVTVPLGPDGSVDLYNHIGTTHVVVDVFGYYQSSPTGSGYSATGPKRMVDTRSGGPFPTLGADATMNLPVATAGLGTTRVSAVVLNVTATNATGDTHLTVFPGNGTRRPGTSNLNVRAGQTVPNLVVVPVDDSGLVNIYNHVGRVDVIVDVFGYFTLPEGGPTQPNILPATTAPACPETGPGRWYRLPRDSETYLFATAGGLSGGPGPTPSWLQVVLTRPDGTTASYSGTPNGPARAGVGVGALSSGQYSFYAYETDGTRVTAPSRPCSFGVDADSVITGVTVTSDGVPGQIFPGQQLTFTFAATSTGTTEGRTIAGFCYSWDFSPAVGCGQIPATDGTASVRLPVGGWGTRTLYAQAFTVSGQASQPQSYSFYVRSQ